jgi:hypothetical protein
MTGVNSAMLRCRALATTATAALLLGSAAASAQEPTTAPDQWSVLVAPYLWAAALDGNAKVRGIEADVDVSFQDTLEDLSFAGMAIVEARKGRFGFAFNPLFVRTNSDARTGPLDAKNTTNIATAGFGAFYRVAEWEIGRTAAGEPLTFAVEPLAGARVNHIRDGVEAKLDAIGRTAKRQVDEDHTWSTRWSAST